jgi:hypothetical protein
MALASAPRRALGLALAAAGLATVVTGGLQAADLRSRLGPMRLLIGPSAVVATEDGTVVVGSAGLSKLHVYEQTGRPLRAWHVETAGAPFALALSSAGDVVVAPAGTGSRLTYTLDGEAVAGDPDAPAGAPTVPDDPRVFEAGSGARYAIEGGRIVRRRAGQEDVLAEGFESHADLTLRIARVVGQLILGAVALLGGVLMTATRKAAETRPA